MMPLPVKIKPLIPELELPRYMSEGASGMDLAAAIEEPQRLEPLQRVLVPCGFSLELPQGMEAQIRPRSGLALRHGITCLNSPGTIDQDYRGEVKVLLVNLSQETYSIQPRERIAQMVFQEVRQVSWELVKDLESTQRAAGGFGSTGR